MKSLASVSMGPMALPDRRAASARIRERAHLWALILAPPLSVSVFLWVTSPNQITFFQWSAALLISCMTWGSYRKWRADRQGSLPLFAMIAFMYWLYYAFPLFWGDRLSVSSAGEYVSGPAVSKAMMMTTLAVISIWLGFRIGIGARLSPKRVPEIPANPSRWTYLWFVMGIGCVAAFFEVPTTVLGDELRQVIYILVSIVPLVPFAILFRHFLQGKSSRTQKIMIAAFLLIYSLISMSSGWLGTLVYLMITCAAIFIAEKGRVPRLAIVFLVIYILFFQVGKFSVRDKYWYNQEEGSKIERIAFWVNQSLDKWGDTLKDPNADSLRQLTYQSLARVSLLTQTANVIELTPNTVPYQYGRLYSYMAVAFIPRFIWPNKPSANEANQFYQVSYGLTLEDDLDHSSFAAGLLAESYINFSWFGVVAIMFLFGVFLDFFQSAFLSASAGLLLRGVGVVLLPYMLSIEGQLATYMGATLQRMAFVLLIFLPIIHLRRLAPGRP